MSIKKTDRIDVKSQEKKGGTFITDLKPNKDEVNRHYERISINHSIRNQILMFSFTSVIASLGAALAIENISVPLSYLFLSPLVILLPFQARISYYRLEAAHLMSYLDRFSPETDKYGRLCKMGFSEDHGIKKAPYTIIAWLVNHELVCLSLLAVMIFLLKYFTATKQITKWTLIAGLVPPAILLVLLFLISESTYVYSDMMNNYDKKLDQLQKKYNQEKLKVKEEKCTISRRLSNFDK